MNQMFRTHRLYQLLSWIDALSRGYDVLRYSQDIPEDRVVDKVHHEPTASNIAYYLLHDGDYKEEPPIDRFASWEGQDGYGPAFTEVKNDVTRYLEQYPADLFSTESVRKTPDTHPALADGHESRRVKTTAYYLSARGRERLAQLQERMEYKRQLVTRNTSVTGRIGRVRVVSEDISVDPDAAHSVAGLDDSETVEIDSVTVPIAGRNWSTKTYSLPHIAVRDASHDSVPTIYRD